MKDPVILKKLTDLLKTVNKLTKDCERVDVEWMRPESSNDLVIEFTLSPDKGIDIHERFDDLISKHAVPPSIPGQRED